MVRSYERGQVVKSGFYFNARSGELIKVNGPDPVIPPFATGKYIRIPAAAVVFLVPLVGLAFVIFLPLTAFVGFFAFAGVKVKKAILKKPHVNPPVSKVTPV